MDDVVPVRAEKALRTRLAVQEAAIELCLESGYTATSTRMIAERAGIAERTLFRTFGTKAAIFWHDPFLSRVIRQLDRRDAPVDPVTELVRAVHATVEAISPGQWRLELGRRKVILQEPELVATGTQEVNLAAGQIADVLTPADAAPDRAFRTMLFARFAVAGFGIVPVYSDTTTADWGQALVRVVHLAAHGPLTDS